MAETINRIASVWFDWQWAMLWQTAVLIGLVAGIDRLIRNRAWPQLRYALWLLVFVKLVLPPGLASPVSVTSRVPAMAQQAVEARVQTPIAPAETSTTLSLPAESTASSSPQTPFVQGQSARLLPVPVASEGPALSWTAYAMAVWLVGVVAMGVGLHVRLRRLAKEHSLSRAADVPAWFDESLAQAASELGLKRVPRVVFSERVCCPAVFGVLRPILLFPAERLPISRRETRHVLLHELAHIKRGDLLVHAGYMVPATVYWFNPLLWLIRKHVQNLRELCCDATVAAHLREETAGYRETLLATGRALLARPVDPGLGLLGLFEGSGWLPIRLQWLQKNTWRYPWLRRISVAAVAGLMLCCILPMASIDAAPSDQKLRVTLPSGITVELVGVRRHVDDHWWHPDGTPLAEAPYDSSEKASGLSNAYEFALRYENLPEGASGGLGVEPGGSSRGGTIPESMDTLKPHKAGKPVDGMAYILVAQKPESETVTVRVDLAAGDWVTEEPEALYRRSSGGWNADMRFSPTLDAIVAGSVPQQQGGTVYTKLFYTLDDPGKQKYDVRLTAVDINNVERPPTFQGGGWSSGGGKTLASSSPEFNLPLEDIAAFNLQVRARTRVEFRNVSLRSSKHQKVEIVTSEAIRPAPAGRQVETPEGFASDRDYSTQTLQAFHLACVNYLTAHPGSELPRKPWLLKFRFLHQVFVDGEYQDAYVSYLQYVTHAGYFRPGGFASLKREDFESSEAGRTPILYCKSLLEREDGKGTNVLFGDGRVEYVTAEQLDRLKAGTH